jgi:hypothetical protein
MAHHGSNPDSPPISQELLDKLCQKEAKLNDLGATGRYPLGKMVNDDEGELRLGVAHTPEKVVLNFGKPVAWIGFDADQADEIAKLLHEHAAAVRNRGA